MRHDYSGQDNDLSAIECNRTKENVILKMEYDFY